jgi:uncharacterized protein (DUF302 family)
VIAQSRHSYTETLALLSKAILDAGNAIFLTIDQAAAAKTVGLTLRPTALIIFGNPKGGTPLMDAYPIAALDLPLKFLVWEDGATVKIAYTPASEIAKRYAIPEDEPHIAGMERALKALVAGLTR